MKSNLVILILAALLGANAYSQTGGSAGAGGTTSGGTGGGTAGAGASANGSAGTGGASASTTTTSTSGGASVRVNQQPLLPGGVAPAPQTPNPNGPVQRPNGPVQQPFPPRNNGINSQPAATNVSQTHFGPLDVNSNQVPVDPNQPIFNANQSPTNRPGVAAGAQGQTEAGTSLTPTAQAGSTNRVFATNAPGLLTNTPPALMRDQALSETDRRLLFQIRAAVFGPNQAAAPLAGTPIHFVLREGSVRLVGTVATEEERQRIENQVQQVPGVVRVFDALQVSQPGTQPTATQPTVPQ